LPLSPRLFLPDRAIIGAGLLEEGVATAQCDSAVGKKNTQASCQLRLQQVWDQLDTRRGCALFIGCADYCLYILEGKGSSFV